MTYGFIGLGNMAAAILRGMAKAGVFAENALVGYNPSTAKVQALQREMPLRACASAREVAAAADVIVLASPIYFYSMTSQMKAVIDRTYAFYQQLEGKTFYFIISCGATDASYTETMLAALRGFTCCLPNAKEGGAVLGISAMEAGEIRGSKAMTEAYELGRGIS